MAAIDFPASPTVGQTFGAANGVIYQWNGTLWLAVGGFNAPSPGGDFSATYVGALGSITASQAVFTFNTVLTGNSGGWYNTSTGRFTPPAGRYYINTNLTTNPTTATALVTVFLRKNGVNIVSSAATGGVGFGFALPVSAEVDANGTDFFDVTVGASTTGVTISGTSQQWFGAFPLSGIKGPPGNPSTMSVKVTKYPANGSWTPDPLMVHGYAVAKGGGGGSATITVDPAYVYGGGAGGEGATATKYFKAGDYTGAQAVTVGAGGAGTGAGQPGAASSIAAWLVASGGGVSTNSFNGGPGGASGTGDIVVPGAAGGSGSITNVNSGLYGGGGVGGGAGGGVGMTYTANGGLPGGVGAANSGGGGGGGSSRAAGPGTIPGAAGGSGFVYVVEYLR